MSRRIDTVYQWLLAGSLALACASPSSAAEKIPAARAPWMGSPHGTMLERILPPAVAPSQLPDRASAGARLTVRYCVQCHHLPSPYMHTSARWQSVVERMVWRMRGEGNMGESMKQLMSGVSAPSADEQVVLTSYLQRHGQRELDSAHPALATPAGQIFSLACSQCHALPDPLRHTAREWPAVVTRMQNHLQWTNRIVGAPELRTRPQLDTAEIVRLLQQYARRESAR